MSEPADPTISPPSTVRKENTDNANSAEISETVKERALNGNSDISESGKHETPSNDAIVSGDKVEGKAQEETSGNTKETSVEEVKESAGEKRKRENDDEDWRVRREKDRRIDNRRDNQSHRRNGDHGDRGGRGGRGGGRGRDGFGPSRFSGGIRTSYDDIPESSDPDEIRKQVEFYFSDSNLYTDKFLLQKVGGPANNPVPISVIHSFKRMRHFQPLSAVVAALKDSTVLDVNDKDEVQRKIPLGANIKVENLDANLNIIADQTRSRSIYAKGFGQETATSQLDIETFFDPYGPINAVRLRRTEDSKNFKGSVFVEFKTEEACKQFLEFAEKPKWNEKDLLILSKEEYVANKAKDVRDGRIQGNRRRNYTNKKDDRDDTNNRSNGGNRASKSSPRHGKGGRDDRRERKNGSKDGKKKDDEDDWRSRRDWTDERRRNEEKAKNGEAEKGDVEEPNAEAKNVEVGNGAVKGAKEDEVNEKGAEEQQET